ncbi:uncharacterized protein LOC123504081 isoform X1 [Portunus trituberculatus]|uniref:uncharacterized protein LOC123504081 isoform X1 n=1 Tax=Portunus trituberculatus TaxID=210409 RepID=UPI001E1CBF1C|nr:uncharacterized protein LOC123504081 isoform X1 [Portunus trituberculatus]
MPRVSGKRKAQIEAARQRALKRWKKEESEEPETRGGSSGEASTSAASTPATPDPHVSAASYRHSLLPPEKSEVHQTSAEARGREAAKVCELHFIPADYEHETSHFDERSGRRLTAKLNVPRLKKDAVPTQIPSCPTYLSSSVQARESPDTRKSENELLLDEDMDIKLEIKEEVNDALTEFVNVLDHVEAVPSPKENYVDTLAMSKPSTCASPSNIQFVAINPPQLEIPSHLMEEAPVDVLAVTNPSITPSTSSASLRKVNPTIPRNEDTDEFHLFGMFVASQLRALPLRDALQAQLEIQTIIAQKRSQSLT